MANTEQEQLYVVNLNFDGGDLGEVITALPSTVEDWLDAGFISPVDENGERLVQVGPRGKLATDEGADPVADTSTTAPRHVDSTTDQ